MSQPSLNQSKRQGTLHRLLARPVLVCAGFAVVLVTGLLVWRDGGSTIESDLLLGTIAGLVGGLGGMALSGRLQKRVTHPVAELTRMMSEVGEGRDDGQPAEIEAEGELRDLVTAFNSVLREMRFRETVLAEHLAGLEKALADQNAAPTAETTAAATVALETSTLALAVHGTASAQPPSAADLLDPQVTSELARMAASGKADFVERVRRLYRENAPAAVKAVIEASTAGDCEATARSSHALKSMSLNMGARVVAETAARIEAQARDLKVVNVDQAQVLHRQLLATLDVLDGYPPSAGMVAMLEVVSPEDQALVEDLRHALGSDQLSLVYQPQFDRDCVTITSVETLIRWNHPTRGFVSPAMFIPLAERHGLIGPITQWVLGRAMREIGDLGNLTLSFNASAVEFADPAFVDELAVLIARHRFDPRRLEIEVTETAVLAEEDEVRRNMGRLHELGLKIALDDFGVGYSSLSHLRLFPFDKLKIDRAFVTGCAESVQSATLVHAVVSIGSALGMEVVAEGVETEAQRQFLQSAGVHAMQGYLLARPEPIEALRARLASLSEPRALSA